MMFHSLRSTVFRAVHPVLILAFAGLVLAQEGAGQSPEGIIGIVEGTGYTRIKIAVPAPETGGGFEGQAADFVETVRQDLETSGFFDVVAPSLYGLVPPAEDGALRHDDWISIGADFLVQIRIPTQDDRIDLEARLYDNNGKKLQFGRRYGGSLELIRRVAHQVSDDLVKTLTGNSGIALTRIAFVSLHGEGKEIYLMDYDGRRVRRLTTTGTINLSPVWSPDGSELLFVSWRGKQPGVYLMSSEGKLGVLKTVGGELSAAPDWSPDGRKLAYTSDVDGNSEIYVLDRTSGQNRRLTFNPTIDTAPAFSPNGREIAFTSDRSGSPQIYLMDSEGLNTRRLSWGSSYNDSPAWSPRGDRLAYASRIDGRFQIVVLDLSSGRVTSLTPGRGNSENPRWSPDGRHLVFSSNRAGSYDIYTMRADGTDVRRLTRGGDSFTPDWSRLKE